MHGKEEMRGRMVDEEYVRTQEGHEWEKRWEEREVGKILEEGYGKEKGSWENYYGWSPKNWIYFVTVSYYGVVNIQLLCNFN